VEGGVGLLLADVLVDHHRLDPDFLKFLCRSDTLSCVRKTGQMLVLDLGAYRNHQQLR
jgi:hypothetical protein